MQKVQAMEQRINRVDKHISFLQNNFRKAEIQKDEKKISRTFRALNRSCLKLMEAHHTYFNDMAQGKYKDGRRPDIRPEFLMARINTIAGILERKKGYFAPKSTAAAAKNAENSALKPQL